MFTLPKSAYQIKTLPKKGRGVFAKKDIPAGIVIGDYLGTIMRPEDEYETLNGLYTMGAGNTYDIFGDPKKVGIHFINHSCANNCEAYPYRGHILYFASRKIFAGEEITVNYGLYAPDDTTIRCGMHACYCRSRFCLGSMHNAAVDFTSWAKLVRREFGTWYNKTPGKYGEKLKPLTTYPALIYPDKKPIYIFNAFGSESKTPQKYNDVKLPSVTELRKRIRETGRRAAFPKLGLTIAGIRDGVLLIEKA